MGYTPQGSPRQWVAKAVLATGPPRKPSLSLLPLSPLSGWCPFVSPTVRRSQPRLQVRLWARDQG